MMQTLGRAGFSRRNLTNDVKSTNLRESLSILSKLSRGVSGGLTSLSGLQNQAAHYEKLVDLLSQDLENYINANSNANGEIPYTMNQVAQLEVNLSNVYDVIIRLQPASSTELGQVLKEIRTLLSISYERENLMQAMQHLYKTINSMQFFKIQYNAELTQQKLMDSRKVKQEMKLDETLFAKLLTEKCDKLKVMLPDLSMTINENIDQFNGAIKLMSVVDALDLDDMYEFDRIIRNEILSEEAKIESDNLELETRVLGEGTFGNVMSAILYEDEVPIQVCVKTLTIDEEIMKDEYVELTNEIAMWAEISHTNVLGCLGLCVKNSYLHIVFEKMKISLAELLHERHISIKPENQKKISRDITLGLTQLHALNIIHRNLNPSNIYFSEDLFNGRVKIGDFGLGFYKYVSQTNGPTVYTPPEVLNATTYIETLKDLPKQFQTLEENQNNNTLSYNFFDWTTSGDIYSLGLVLWEMGQDDLRPYESQEYNLHEFVGKQGNRPVIFSGKLEDWTKELIAKCWEQKAENRPTSQQVCEIIISKFSAAPTPPGRKKQANQPTEVLLNPDNMEEHLNMRKNSRNPIKKTASRQSQNTQASRSEKQPTLEELGANHPIKPSRSSVRIFDTHVVDISENDPGKLVGRSNSYTDKSFATSISLNRNSVRRENIQSVRRSLTMNSAMAMQKMKFPDFKPPHMREDDEGTDLDTDIEVAPGTIQLAIGKCSKPGKVNPRIRSLPDEIMKSDRLDLDTAFFYFWLKKINDLDCEALNEILLVNNSFLRLSLEFNKITNDGVESMAEGIGRHKKLLQVFLGNNKGLSNPEKLLKVLEENEVLEVLSFVNCSIGDLGAYHIGEFLKKNTTLLQLDISQNKIGNEGFRRIAEGLKENDGLQSLIVSSNDGVKGMKVLKAVAKQKGMILNKRVIQI